MTTNWAKWAEDGKAQLALRPPPDLEACPHYTARHACPPRGSEPGRAGGVTTGKEPLLNQSGGGRVKNKTMIFPCSLILRI